MTVHFMYHDKQLAVYHGNFFSGKGLWIKKVYIKSVCCILEVVYLMFILMCIRRYYIKNQGDIGCFLIGAIEVAVQRFNRI